MKVYIASPYTIGDAAVNVKRQIDAANALMNIGLTPFLPLLSHFQHLVHPRPYEDWLKNDIAWLLACDCVLRLDGASKGADYEVEVAKANSIPVYYSIDDLINSK
jgi:nucleoside 2-deoxyribosyltransferase